MEEIGGATDAVLELVLLLGGVGAFCIVRSYFFFEPL
jgi:hypothetical protein